MEELITLKLDQLTMSGMRDKDPRSLEHPRDFSEDDAVL